ncbi:hypothetical protein HMP0721_2088 [Pseudoramibacter alactolyticus ATCC 23263]|uniref:ATPase n=1 Tax=Pseudoramibacter alactolyticus ATCC 23263 TaxID=887929 RepID=E6MJA3_9FIRM|nr:hypothetical protein [Pseudoramibacter alactolyticus]EFV00923.1 hypothetical protein HMP0721_2088 [Pseudoramibacter alactolyticus ATCC 23263]
MKVTDLLKELEELIERGNAVPFSSKAMISPDEALEIIGEIKEELPRELSESREIVAEKKQILFEAQASADRIKNSAEKQMKAMVDTDEVTKAAQTQAEIIVENAQTQAKEIRVGTQRYADKILHELQTQLKALNDQIEDNRREIKELK